MTTFGVTILFGLISLSRLISTLKWRFVVSVNMPIDSLVVNTLVTSVHVVSYFGSISYQDVVRSMDLLLKSLLDVILLVIVEIVMNSYYYRHLKRVLVPHNKQYRVFLSLSHNYLQILSLKLTSA